MPRRKLTDKELEDIASKKWKQTPVYSSDEKVINKVKNLTGPKTVEGKKNSLKNLMVGRNKQESTISHGGYVRRMLTEDEVELYEARKEIYERDFELNESSDQIVLHMLLMDEVIHYRLNRRMADHPSEYEKLQGPINDCAGRISRALDDLGAKRKQRLKQDEKVHAVSIATISKQFARELMSGDIHLVLQENEEEEREFLEQKKKKEAANRTIDAEYEVIDEEEDGNDDDSE